MMKNLCVLIFLFCTSMVMAQKQFGLKFNFVTNDGIIASNVRVKFFKDIADDVVVVKELRADDKGILNFKLADNYFDETDSVFIQAFFEDSKIYYLNYEGKFSKKQFPLNKTIVFESMAPVSLDEIDGSIPHPPTLPKRSK